MRFNAESRGASEIIFIALFTAVVLFGGAFAFSSINAISSDTKDDFVMPEFELSNTNPIIISFSGPEPVTGEYTKEIYLEYKNESGKIKELSVFPEGNKTTISASGDIVAGNHSLTRGDIVFNSDYSNAEIEYGDNVNVFWIKRDGGGRITQTIYIPPSGVTGTSVRQNGTVTITGGEPNTTTTG